MGSCEIEKRFINGISESHLIIGRIAVVGIQTCENQTSPDQFFVDFVTIQQNRVDPFRQISRVSRFSRSGRAGDEVEWRV